MTAPGRSKTPAPAGDTGERIVRQLGELVGLIKVAEGEWELDTDWFKEPLARLEAIPSERLGELVALLETLLGPAAASRNGGADWYPLRFGEDKGAKAGSKAGPSESGFGLVVEEESGIAGLGFRPPVKLPMGARFEAFVPLVDKSDFVGASDDHPPRLTLDLLPPGGEGERFGDEHFSFKKLHLEADLFFTKPPAVAFELTAVRFPGEEKPEDLSVVDQIADIRDHPDKWIKRLLRLLLVKVDDRLDSDGQTLHATVSNLLLVLGLSLDETGPEDVDVPSPDWSNLVGHPGVALAAWLHELADPKEVEVLTTWLSAWVGLLRSVDAAEVGEIPGSGAPDDPFLVPMRGSAAGRSLALSLALQDGGDGRQLTPGLRLASGAYEPAEGVAAHLEAKLDAARIRLSPGGAHIDATCPRLELLLVIDGPDGGPLFELADPKPENSIVLEAVHAGLRLTHEGGSFHFEPVLELAGAVVAPSEKPEVYSLLGGGGRESNARATLARALLRAFELYQPFDLSGEPPALADAAEQKALADLVAPDIHEQIAWQIFGPRFAGLRDVLLELIFGSQKPDPQVLIDETPERLEALLAGLSDPLELMKAFARRFESGDFNPLVGWLFAESIPGFEAPAAGEPPFFGVPLGEEVRLGIGCPEAGRFGIELQPSHETGRVNAGAEIKASIDISDPGLPDIEITARLGLSSAGLGMPELEPGPELSVSLGVKGGGDPDFSTWLWLTGKPADGEDGLLMALLPEPYLAYRLPPDPEAKRVQAKDWFLRLGPRLLRPLVDGLLLSQEKVYSRLDRPFAATGVSAGLVLTKWKLLVPEGGEEAKGPYKLADSHTLAGLEPKGLVAAALTAFGDQAEAGGVRLFPLEADEDEQGEPAARGVYVVRSKVKEYGVRLVATDVAMGKRASRLVLQLGKPPHGVEKWLQEARDAADEHETGPPGVTLFLVKDQDGVHFAPRLELVDVGFDLRGAGGGSDKPTALVRKGGYEIAGLQPRLYLSTEPFKLGAAIQVAGIGIPLGPPSGGGNPVAQNLLGSGGGEEAAAEANPTFSATLAYAGKLWGEIHGDVPSSDGKVWLPVQRAFGPLFCRRIGLDFESETTKLYVGYDGKVSVGPLELDLVDLSVGIPLREPANLGGYELGLEGLSLSFDKPPISIAGSLFKTTVGGVTEYAGSAVIKTQAMTISGFGVFGSIDGEISMFVFALLDKDLGGPSFFHVTGLAAGFGYNRDLKLPSIDHVEEFPLIKGVLSPGYFGKSKDPSGAETTDPKQALVKLHEYLPAKRGSYWLALGVKFTSFEMIESVALLAVKFGTQTVISLLGVSTLAIPKGASSDDAIAYARLLLRAELVPSEGTLKVDGKLTDDSHVFSKDCHLRGGFAFYTWFKGKHEGDFVVTVGGYHPKFVPKPHYPVVERLGFDWAISSHLHVDGELFFALTPSCLMAGGRLSAIFQSGGLKAWYIAHADFLMYWQPFHYEINIGISVGVSYTFKVIVTITLKIELSAELSLFGPPFAGKARLCWGPLDFTIRFGPQNQKIEPLGWKDFREKMLPAQPISIDVTGGLIRQDPVKVVVDKATGRVAADQQRKLGAGQEERTVPWPVVNSHELRIATRSALPSTRTTLARGTVEGDGGPALGIRPMDRRQLDCPCEVEIRPLAGGELSEDAAPLQGFVQRTGVPHAMWGPEEWEEKLAPGAKVIDEVPSGMTLRLGFHEPTHALPPLAEPGIALEKLKYEPIPKQLCWLDIEVREEDPDGKKFKDSIWGDVVIEPRRSTVRAALQSVTPFPLNEIELGLFQKTWEQAFQARPRWSSLGAPER